MGAYKKDILRATAVVLLVIVLSVATYFLFPDVPQQVTYGTGVTIQDSRPATEDFINRTLESGGGYTIIEYSPLVHLTFENGTELFYSESKEWMNETWATEATINASGLQEVRVDWFQAASGQSSSSKEFQTYVAEGNFSWYGSYSRGYVINSTLLVDNNRTDFGTRSENNVLLAFTLNSNTIGSARWQAVDMIYPEPVASASKYAIWQTELYWEAGGWRMETSRLLQMIGQSESASVVFDGSAWLGGNYTVNENGIVKNSTVYSTENVSFGRMDVTFENGRISTLSFKLNTIDIILFARPEQ
jgi:hypothetical protein